MEEKFKYRCFVWYHSPSLFGENNDGELQEMLDNGWEIDVMTNPVIMDSRCIVFVSLIKEENVAEEED